MTLQFSDDVMATKFLELCQDVAHIKQSQEDTRTRLFGGDGAVGAIPYLHTEVSKHGRQLTFWRGAVAVLTFMWSAAIAWGSVILSRHK
jgi:hypothetical protein